MSILAPAKAAYRAKPFGHETDYEFKIDVDSEGSPHIDVSYLDDNGDVFIKESINAATGILHTQEQLGEERKFITFDKSGLIQRISGADRIVHEYWPDGSLYRKGKYPHHSSQMSDCDYEEYYQHGGLRRKGHLNEKFRFQGPVQFIREDGTVELIGGMDGYGNPTRIDKTEPELPWEESKKRIAELTAANRHSKSDINEIYRLKTAGLIREEAPEESTEDETIQKGVKNAAGHYQGIVQKTTYHYRTAAIDFVMADGDGHEKNIFERRDAGRGFTSLVSRNSQEMAELIDTFHSNHAKALFANSKTLKPQQS